ncbi:MAG: ATP-binding protein [Xenococcaceae cyanobacterium]
MTTALSLPRPLLSVSEDTLENQCYRPNEKERIVASLLAGQSLYVVGNTGIGKTALAEFVETDLRERGFPVVLVRLATPKQMMVQIAEAFGVETENLEGKSLTTIQLQKEVKNFLQRNNGFILLDHAPSVSPTIRLWLEELYNLGQPMLLVGKTQPKKDILFKLVAMRLEPMSPVGIRRIMKAKAMRIGFEVSDAELARLQQVTGGNPAIAIKAVIQQYLGIENKTAPEHKTWFGLTRYIIAAFLIIATARVVGQATNDDLLKIVGGGTMMAVTVGQLFMAPMHEDLGGRT